MTTKNIKTFELLTELCQSAGGDGDACIVSEYYMNFANQYEKWVNETYKNMYNRTDGENFVSFYEQQESILFCNDNYKLPAWVDNILIHPWLDLENEK